MLAQATQGAVDAAAIALASVVVALGPLSVACTKGCDFIRNLLDRGDTWPKWVWNVVPIGVGLGLCLGFQINVVAPLATKIPALAASSAFDGTAGQVLTALVAGTFAGFWHEKLDSLSHAAKA